MVSAEKNQIIVLFFSQAFFQELQGRLTEFQLALIGAQSEKECLEHVADCRPCAVILEVHNSAPSDCLIQQLKQHQPVLSVWCAVRREDLALAVRFLKAGADDILEIPPETEKLLPMVQRVLKLHNHHKVLGSPLTKVEKLILIDMLHGMNNQQIAEKINRSVRTIEDHRCRIMKKFGVENSIELMNRAREMGLDG